MKAHREYYIGVLAALALFVCGASAATVRGQILYASDNSPAAYIAVRLNSDAKGPSEFVYSGSDGRYYINGIPPGEYRLEVWRGGKVVFTVTITVQEPVTDVATIRMPV